MKIIIKLSIVFLVLGIVLISGCIDSEKPSEIGGPTKPVNGDVSKDEGPKEWIELDENIKLIYECDGKPVYVTENEGKTIVIYDGKEGKQYDSIDITSKGGIKCIGEKIAYVAQKAEGLYTVVYNGGEGKQYEKILILRGTYQLGSRRILTTSNVMLLE